MHGLAERVLEHIRRQELLQPGDRVGVAVSGGIDSVALLRLLIEWRSELGIVVSVVHFDHRLRGAESEADREFVAGLAREHGLEFYVESGDVGARAVEEHLVVEAAAREMRYGFFRRLLGSGEERPLGAKAQVISGATDRSAESAAPPQSQLLTRIATGHTLDDQAETVLMRVIRGTGLGGLGGIYPRIGVEDDDGEGCGEIIRPLLGMRRRELEQYLKEIKQPWREDSSNKDYKFTRNRVRQLVLPLIEREFNPSIAENLAELAEIARGEEDYWENEIAGWLGTVVQWSEPEWSRGTSTPGCSPFIQIQLDAPASNAPASDVPASDAPAGLLAPEEPVAFAMNASVDRRWLLGEPEAVQRRVVKAVGDEAEIPLEFKHVEEILRFAAEAGGAGKKVSLPRGWTVLLEPEALTFLAPDPRQRENIPRDYEYQLSVPGRVSVPEIGMVMEALPLAAGYNPEHLLDGELLNGEVLDSGLLQGTLRVRNWRPGDRYWPAHTKAPKKIKELLQERQVAQPERGLWPVVVSGEEIVWMRGFAVPAKFRAKGSAGVLIRETRLGEDSTKVRCFE
ncbi:MAG TPA: tRNA lysidine(34) synthetase TilS [Candidatus Sulfotelmatobacter sp.]|nr:tRNA lysidine(34) synthetase TilS [Candidatus Sulfotelmatobacter sp.]